MEMTSKFACAIWKARTALGYTQGEVAETISVSLRWYQKLESGRKLPGSVTLIRLILFLHLDVEDLREEAGIIVPVRSIQRKLSFQ